MVPKTCPDHYTGVTPVGGWIAIGVIAVFALRAMLRSVTASADGVRIRGLIRTHILGWPEIDHFSLGRLGLYPAVGIVHPKRGKPLAMSAIEVAKLSTAQGRANAEAMIAELNQLLAEHRGGDEPRAETRAAGGLAGAASEGSGSGDCGCSAG